MTERELSAAARRLLDDVDTHGWHSQHVFDPELARPNFSYSVGFTQTLGAPEFIVFGLHRDVMHDMLGEVFRQLKAGRKVEGDQRWHGLTEDFDCIGKKASHDGLRRKRRRRPAPALGLGRLPFPVPHLLPHDPVRAARLDAFEAARPEGAAGFGPVLIHAAYGLAAAQLQMHASPAIELDECLPAFGKQAAFWQGARRVPWRQGEIARMPAETAGAAGHAVK